MKKKRSLLSVLLVLGLLFTFTSFAFAASFTDLQGHWAQNQIQKWADQGLAGGYADGTFKPNNSVTRAEFVAMTNRAFNISSEGTVTGFSDVVASQWFYSEVMAAKTAGYIGGYSDGTFKPNQSITRQEAASIVARLLQLDANTTVVDKFADANTIPAWSKGSIGALVQNGLMGGFPDNTFQPAKNITRAEALVSLDRALEFKPEEVVVEVESAIEGAVTFEGRAYSGVTVQVFEADSYELLEEVKADSKGNFKVELLTGKYDLTATTSDKVAYLSDVVVTANKIAKANMALEKAAVIKGSVVDPKNADVKEATMAFTTNPTFVTETNKSGKFTVALLPNHTYTVRVYEPGEEDKKPDVVEKEFKVGTAGEYTLEEAFETSFTVSRSGGGGGGGVGGGGGTTPSDTLTLTDDYNGNGETLDKNVVINADNVTLSNVTITKDLTIGTAVNEFTADNVTVEGQTYINGGSSNSVHLKNFKAKKEVVINKAGVRLVASGTSTFEAPVKIKVDGVKLEAEDGSTVTLNEVSLESEGTTTLNVPVIKLKVASENTVIEGNGTITELSIETLGKITINASVERVVIRIDDFDPSKIDGSIAEDLESKINYAPKKEKDITITNLLIDTYKVIDLSDGYFSDKDTDELEYSATSSDADKLEVGVSGTELTLTAKAAGTVTVTITVTDARDAVTEYSFTVTVIKPQADLVVPVDHTLPAFLDAIEQNLALLTEEQWSNLKNYRNDFLKNSNSEDITEEDIRNSLIEANLLEPFQCLLNSNLTIEEVAATLDVFKALAYLGKDNVTDNLPLIEDKVQELKTTYNDEVDRLLGQNVNQEAIYNYVIDVYLSLLAGDYNLDTTDDTKYEKSLYNAALEVLRNGNHSELEGVCENAYNRVSEHYTNSTDSTIGIIIKGISFSQIDGSIAWSVKNAADSIATENELQDLKDMLNLFDFMLDISETFLK